MRALALGLILGVSVVVAVPALAQTGTSEIGGKVTDPQGGILPGVAIVLTNQDTGVFRELVTGSDGSYFVSQIVPGRYRISAKLSGFRGLDRRDGRRATTRSSRFERTKFRHSAILVRTRISTRPESAASRAGCS